MKIFEQYSNGRVLRVPLKDEIGIRVFCRMIISAHIEWWNAKPFVGVKLPHIKEKE